MQDCVNLNVVCEHSLASLPVFFNLSLKDQNKHGPCSSGMPLHIPCLHVKEVSVIFV